MTALRSGILAALTAGGLGFAPTIGVGFAPTVGVGFAPTIGVGFAPSIGVGFAPSIGVGFASGFDTITQAELERDVRALSSAGLEGRDTPSLGLERAARAIEERFRVAGLAFAPDSAAAWKKIVGSDPPAGEGSAVASSSASVLGTFRRPFDRRLPKPAPTGCSLVLEVGTPDAGGSRAAPAGGSPAVPGGNAPSAQAGTFELGRDFVPVRGCEGEAAGEIVFAGYGIQSKTEKYDDFAGLKLKGRIALIVEGEPRTKDRRFDGAEIGRAASLWEKVDALFAAGAAGVLAARRPSSSPEEPGRPAPDKSGSDKSGKDKPPAAAGAVADAESGLSFRSTWAEFNGVASDPPPRHPLPVLEVSIACATEILGQNVEALVEKIDKSVHPVRATPEHGPAGTRRVRMRGRTDEAEVRVDNLVGLVRGEDSLLAEEYVVLGAHYDHVGIDARGRIGYGADDNASGVAAMLEIAQALAAAGTRRSVFCCAFAGEEAGLLGSRAFCAVPPVPADRIVAMVNLDMIGRGDASELAALGVAQNPAFDKLIARAKKLRASGVREVVLRQGEDLFERSDHFSFHKIGVPALFFFEGLPIDRNKDYHTWRDTADKLDFGKMLNTTKLVYNVTWILTQDDERPPPPRG